MKATHKLALVALLAGATAAGHAADWNQSAVGVRWGAGFADPGITRDFRKTIYSYENVNGDKLGTNLFVLDVLRSGAADQAVGGGGAAQELYALYQRTYSLSAITGNKDGYGPFKDISLVARGDFGSKEDGFGARPRKLRLGMSVAMPLTAGFWNIGLQAYKHNDHNGITGRDVTYKVAPLLASSWMVPLAGIATFSGYADVIGSKGKDGFGAETATEVLVFAKLMLPLGASGVHAGIGYEYWKNKYGTDSSHVPGAKHATPLLLAEYHF
jgi:hypothetical protein